MSRRWRPRETAGGERRAIGRFHEVGFLIRNRAERYEPAGRKDPKGERKRGKGLGAPDQPSGNGPRALISTAAAHAARGGGSPKAERAWRRCGGMLKGQAGIVDPATESPRGEIAAGERKAVPKRRPLAGERADVLRSGERQPPKAVARSDGGNVQ